MGASSIVSGFFFRVLGSILIVALVIFLADTLNSAFGPAISGLKRIPEIESALKSAQSEIHLQFDEADRNVARLRGKTGSEIKRRIDAIDSELKKLGNSPHLKNSTYLKLAVLLQKDQLDLAIRNEIRMSVLREERKFLVHLSESAAQPKGEPVTSLPSTEDLLENWKKRSQNEAKIRSEVGDLEKQISCRIRLTDCSVKLREAIGRLRKATDETWAAHDRWKSAVPSNNQRQVPSEALSRIDRSAITTTITDLQKEMESLRGWHETAFDPVEKALYSAIKIVGAALAGAFAFKLAFYYVFAPLAARCAPTVVREASGSDRPVEQVCSALSVQIEMSADQELVALGSCLQSVADGAKTSTKFFFSNWHPLTSFLTGLWILTKLRVKTPTQVVLSATTDPLQELSVVRLTAGQSLVILPRHLVGVLHAVKHQPRLRGTWKFDVHAFLTLQFRYLALSGPCTLIVAGCRGVRVESAEVGRSISQAMTVGFSANLDYSVSRTETFIPYLLGQRPLFNDRFRGVGAVLYQEVPASATRGGFTGRGLQGVLDGILKAFGI